MKQPSCGWLRNARGAKPLWKLVAVGDLTCCYTPSPHKFTETEIDILSSIANQAAVAIENTELMVKSRVIQEELESRKRFERAKGILMKTEGLTEEEAYFKIRKYSMDNRKTTREVAKAIILSVNMRKHKR